MRSQGALLLTHFTSAEDPLSASSFLANSIQAAVEAGAHLWEEAAGNSPTNFAKKRLWWSIFVRDRILSLSLKRPPQILSANFTFPSGFIEDEDIPGESLQSEVYDTGSKKAMINLWKAHCQLALRLTSLIMIVCPPGGVCQANPLNVKDTSQSEAELNLVKTSLDAWYTSARPLMESLVEQSSHVTLFKDIILLHY
jgi:hypothetical protein